MRQIYHCWQGENIGLTACNYLLSIVQNNFCIGLVYDAHFTVFCQIWTLTLPFVPVAYLVFWGWVWVKWVYYKSTHKNITNGCNSHLCSKNKILSSFESKCSDSSNNIDSIPDSMFFCRIDSVRFDSKSSDFIGKFSINIQNYLQNILPTSKKFTLYMRIVVVAGICRIKILVNAYAYRVMWNVLNPLMMDWAFSRLRKEGMGLTQQRGMVSRVRI